MYPPVRELGFYRIVFSQENIDFSGDFHPALVCVTCSTNIAVVVGALNGGTQS